MISAVNEFLDDLRGGRMTEAPVVTVDQGQLQGRAVASSNGKAYYSFQGIPYAKPPLGSLRFKAPQPAEPWEGIRDATSEGNISPQIDHVLHKAYAGDENCLYLNVYTPNLDGAFLPVMVYIHGGAFKYGSGSSALYGGDLLVEKDVVVVTINYRLGVLGFLSLNTPEVPGNAGLKDMVQAIRWVKDNIHNFGGNSGNVTVFGESCGGITTSILTASPLSKDLINKAIIQSGTGLNPLAFQKNPVENAKKLAHLLGSEAEDVDEILDYLTATSAKELVEATEKLHPLELLLESNGNYFVAIVEKEFPGVDAVITESFHDLIVSGRSADIPLMVGTTTLECATQSMSDDLQSCIPEELRIERNSEEALEVVNKIKSLYFKGGHIGVESLKEYYELLSDKVVNIVTHRYIRSLVKVSRKPIYYYKFDYVGELNLAKKLLDSLDLKQAVHMDEIGYLFSTELLKDAVPTSQDLKTRERMVRLWTNFAKSGNPTPEENHYITVTWLPVTNDNLYYLNIGEELSLGSNPDKERMDFWDELYTKHFRIWEHPSANTAENPAPIIVEETVATPEVSQSEDVQETVVIETAVETVDGKEEKSNDVEPEVEIEETKPQIVDEVPVNTVEEVPEAVEVVPPVEEVQPVEVVQPVVEDKPDFEPEVLETKPEIIEEVRQKIEEVHVNGNGIEASKPVRTSNEIKMVQNANGAPKDVIRANDPPEDDLPKNIGVNKFVNFFESLGGRK